MELPCSQHFRQREALRIIPKGLAEDVFQNADSYFNDSVTDTFVAVKRALFHGVSRDVALIYRRIDAREVIFSTIHPLQNGQKERRIQGGRWTLYAPESAL